MAASFSCSSGSSWALLGGSRQLRGSNRSSTRPDMFRRYLCTFIPSPLHPDAPDPSASSPWFVCHIHFDVHPRVHGLSHQFQRRRPFFLLGLRGSTKAVAFLDATLIDQENECVPAKRNCNHQRSCKVLVVVTRSIGDRKGKKAKR